MRWNRAPAGEPNESYTLGCMASVQLDCVSKDFSSGAESPAVREVSLSIPDGQFVVLVGPSGCGKSTTLRMIAGLEQPTGGRVMIGERDVTDVSPRDRDVAMVFQNYALYPHMTVRKNLSFALKLRGMAKDQIAQKVELVAGMLGIVDLLERRPGQLSGGQRQRVAVGRAIVREPQVFLFDEPLSNLDAKLRVATRGELKLLHQQLRTTTVYVTHDQEEAMTLGDRIVVLHKGRVMQDAPPHEVFERPANRFVASFIGTPPMNFVDGQLQAMRGGGGGGGGLEFVSHAGGAAAMRWLIPSAMVPALGAHAARPLTLGIRPTSLRESESGASGPVLKGDIVLVELLGEHSDVIVQTPWGRVVARVPTRPGLVAGAQITLTTDAARVHFFDAAEEGQNLLHAADTRAEHAGLVGAHG